MCEPSLRYVSFTRKELQLALPKEQKELQDIRLFWQAPGKNWQMLQGYETRQDGSRLSMIFDHPKPLSHGTYKLMVTCQGGGGEKTLVSLMTFRS
ncbi:MAG: hypothetical protein ACOX4G_09090 [Limnochordia bacterium]